MVPAGWRRAHQVPVDQDRAIRGHHHVAGMHVTVAYDVRALEHPPVGVARDRLFEAGETREIVRTLAAGTTIRGVLLDELHQPLRARVQLALVATTEPSLRIAGATTGPGGRFTFEDVPPGTWRIESMSGRTGDARGVVPQEVTIAEGTPVIEVRVGYRR